MSNSRPNGGDRRAGPTDDGLVPDARIDMGMDSTDLPPKAKRMRVRKRRPKPDRVPAFAVGQVVISKRPIRVEKPNGGDLVRLPVDDSLGHDRPVAGTVVLDRLPAGDEAGRHRVPVPGPPQGAVPPRAAARQHRGARQWPTRS